MGTLATIDIIVLAGYFVLILIIGLWSYSSVKDTGDYFMGKRRFGKILMIAHALGTGTHTEMPVSVAGASAQIGLAGIWYQFMWLFSTPFYWLLSPIYRRMRYITIGDFFENRYSSKLGVFYAFWGLLIFVVNIGTLLKGTGTTVEGITGGGITSSTAILIMTIVILIFGLAGGLVAAMWTDLIQGTFIVIMSFLMVPFAILDPKVGGFSGLHQKLSAEMFSLVAPHEVTLFFVIMAVITGLVGIVVQPHHMAVAGSGKGEFECRMGWAYGNFIKRFCTIGWSFIGIAGAIIFAGEFTPETRELVFGMSVTRLLPPGLVGLMLASIIAAAIGMTDAFMVDGAALFTRNFYQRYMKKTESEKHYLFVARLSSALMVLGGIAFALYIPNVIFGLKIMWKLNAYMGIAFWVGMIWRRANSYGAWTSMILSAILSLSVGETLPWGLGWSLEWESALYLPIGFATMIIVSLLTPEESKEKLDNFYTLIHTPVGEEKKLRDKGVPIILEREGA